MEKLPETKEEEKRIPGSIARSTHPISAAEVRKGLDRLRSALIGLAARSTGLSRQVRERACERGRRNAAAIQARTVRKKLARFLNHVLARSLSPNGRQERLTATAAAAASIRLSAEIPPGTSTPRRSLPPTFPPEIKFLSSAARRLGGRAQSPKERARPASLVCMACRAAIHQGMKRASGILQSPAPSSVFSFTAKLGMTPPPSLRRSSSSMDG